VTERTPQLRVTTSRPSTADVDVAAVVIEPRGDDPRTAWDEAEAAFEEVGARAVPPDDADEVAKVAAVRLRDT
jgi:hypothetical protein